MRADSKKKLHPLLCLWKKVIAPTVFFLLFHCPLYTDVKFFSVNALKDCKNHNAYIEWEHFLSSYFPAAFTLVPGPLVGCWKSLKSVSLGFLREDGEKGGQRQFQLLLLRFLCFSHCSFLFPACLMWLRGFFFPSAFTRRVWVEETLTMQNFCRATLFFSKKSPIPSSVVTFWPNSNAP